MLLRLLKAQKKWMRQKDATYVLVHYIRIRENDSAFWLTGEIVGEVKAVVDMHQRKEEMARHSGCLKQALESTSTSTPAH